MSINNIQHFLLAQEDNIVSIPGLLERIERLEARFTTDTVTEGDQNPEDDQGSEDDEQDSEEIFRQEDHDELFADGGATEQSWDRGDHAELFESPNI